MYKTIKKTNINSKKGGIKHKKVGNIKIMLIFVSKL